ncbi:hypothetical protein D5085_00640 [Ectothiorhodospiraceae bacterium BW-2]|nr:hypothetical protein D5085_00640 [Ectothiorhodospiraceae bacterium BW-2]
MGQEAYYQHIQQEEGIEWAQWREGIARTLGLIGDHFRRLHAKVYHFYNGRASWVFVGSVNFTYKAIHENVEAGFLARLDTPGPLLEPMPEDRVVEQFADLDEAVPGMESDKGDEVILPDLHLCYDWVSKQLKGRTKTKRKRYEIEILGPEGEPVIEPWAIPYQEVVYEGETGRLEKALRNGSLVKVRGRELDRRERPIILAHPVLLQQIGWSHKPLDLPALSAEQILAIYAGMSQERRQMMLVDAKIRALVLSAQGGELTVHTDDQIIEQFFCEYAEIFNAFSRLRKRLEASLEAEQYHQLDYYLTGKGVDSIPSLIERATRTDENDKPLNAVTTYLLLLSALELYRLDEFSGRPAVEALQHQLMDQIEALKSGDRLVLEDDTPKNRKTFFKWFEEEFFRAYKPVDEGAA